MRVASGSRRGGGGGPFGVRYMVCSGGSVDFFLVSKFDALAGVRIRLTQLDMAFSRKVVSGILSSSGSAFNPAYQEARDGSQIEGCRQSACGSSSSLSRRAGQEISGRSLRTAWPALG